MAATTDPTHTPDHGDHPEQFDQDISIKGILYTGLGLAALCVVSFVLMWGLFVGFRSLERGQDPEPSPLEAARERRIPVGPTLQSTPTGDMDRMRQEEELRLNRWGLTRAVSTEAASTGAASTGPASTETAATGTGPEAGNGETGEAGTAAAVTDGGVRAVIPLSRALELMAAGKVPAPYALEAPDAAETEPLETAPVGVLGRSDRPVPEEAADPGVADGEDAETGDAAGLGEGLSPFEQGELTDGDPERPEVETEDGGLR